MTLLLGMIKEDGIYLSTDYRVSDARTGSLIDDVEPKFLSIQCSPIESGPVALMAFAGVARLRDGTPMSTWLRETLRGEAEVFDDLMAHLRTRLDRDIAAYREPLIVNLIVKDEKGVYFGGFSNREFDSGIVTRSSFGYHLESIKVPFWFANGSGAEALRDGDRKLIEAQLRVKPRKPRDHLKLLSAVNRRVAARERTVSPFCHVSFAAWERGLGEAEVFTEGKEAPPFAMPALLGPVDLSGVTRRTREDFRRRERGEPLPDWDLGAVNRELERRP